MNHISDESYYNIYIPVLNLLARRNHPDKSGCGELHFEEVKDDYKVRILSFDCFVCGKFIEMPSYNPDGDEGVQIIRNHLINDLKQKNLLPFI